ncbi:hypothetical protein J6590_028120 [Homalodisca vitripennis]|nr:hypothetical protein J6590_028120 [Homalodisca vitripennis]
MFTLDSRRDQFGTSALKIVVRIIARPLNPRIAMFTLDSRRDQFGTSALKIVVRIIARPLNPRISMFTLDSRRDQFGTSALKIVVRIIGRPLNPRIAMFTLDSRRDQFGTSEPTDCGQDNCMTSCSADCSEHKRQFKRLPSYRRQFRRDHFWLVYTFQLNLPLGTAKTDVSLKSGQPYGCPGAAHH